MQEQINGLGETKEGPQRALRPQEKRDTTNTVLYLSKLGSTAKSRELNDTSISSQRFIPLTRTETDCDKSSRTNIAC